MDRAAIAKEVYCLLPDQIGGHDIIFVNNLIPPERFAQLVQDAFDRFDRFAMGHQAHFDELYEAWKQENVPVDT